MKLKLESGSNDLVTQTVIVRQLSIYEKDKRFSKITNFVQYN